MGTDCPRALWGLVTWEWLGAGPLRSLVTLGVSEDSHRVIRTLQGTAQPW